MAETDEITAQRIAERGREALLERLRSAFEEAAAAHADVLKLDEGKLEEMIERAADRADGLQWRRALAAVATEELGIGLAEALVHPAVVRAQAIVGAPSYEEGLAAIAAGKAPEPGRSGSEADGPADGAPAGGAPLDGAPSDVALAGGAPSDVALAGGAPEAAAAAAAGGETLAPASGEAGREPGAGASPPPGLPVGVEVVHVEGLPELMGEGELELQFTAEGLSVWRASGGTPLLAYAWSALRRVEVGPARGRILRRRGARLTLSVGSRRARFEVGSVGPDELRERLAPALAMLQSERGE